MSISLRCTAVLLTAVIVAACNGEIDPATAPSSPRDVQPALAPSPPTPAAYVKSGGSHACALRTEGTIACWGNDVQYWSQPGFGGSPQPNGVFTQLDAHGRSACAVSTAGQISCWGVAGWGQNNAPPPPAGLTFRQASMGALTACGLLSNGAVTCWGDGRYGLLSPPAGVFTDVAVGYTHACAVRDDGTLACWGTGSMSNAPTPAADRRFVQVASGNLHSCVLTDDGTVQCWGDNTNGELNVPALPAGVRYTQVSVSNEARADPASGTVSCALRSDGAAVCWGSSGRGQLGVPALPADVVYTSVSASNMNGCASRSDGAVLCWGLWTTGLSNVPATLNLLKKTQPIAFTPAVPNPAVVGRTFDLVPNVGSGNPVELSLLTPATCAISEDQHSVSFTAEGSCSFTADREGNADYEDAPRLTVTVNVTSGNQSITFTSAPPSPAYYGGGYGVSAAGGASGNPVTFSSLTPATCTVDGNNVTFVGIGDCTVAADQAGNASYNAAAQVTQTFAIARSPQTIKFTSQAPSTAYVGDTYTANATVGANGNVVAIAAGPAAVCTATGNAIAFVASGTCTVTATQAGNTYYEPATPSTQTITVARRAQTISLTLPAEGVMGTQLTVAATGGASGNPVTLRVTTASTCVLSGTTLSLTNIGSCTIVADQAGSTAYDAAASKTVTVAVRWPFTGFFGLLAPPALNTGVRPGNTVAVTFSLGGNRGTSVLAGSPTVAPYPCTATTLPAPGAGMASAGSLAYSATTGRYTYNYATLKTRTSGSCLQFSLKLADGSVRTLLFQFK